MRTTYRVYFEEKDGSCNQILIEADKLSDAVAYVEGLSKCQEVYKVEEA